jgi:hypothetical protein
MHVLQHPPPRAASQIKYAKACLQRDKRAKQIVFLPGAASLWNPDSLFAKKYTYAHYFSCGAFVPKTGITEVDWFK